MESGPQRTSVDLTSRILSIVSLTVAIAAVGFLYSQSRVSGTRDQLVASFDETLAGEAKVYADARKTMEERYQTALDRQDARMENWNTQLNDAITTFRQDATSLLTRIDDDEQTASDDRQLAFRSVMRTMGRESTEGNTTPGDDVTPPTVTPEDIADTKPAIGADGSGEKDPGDKMSSDAVGKLASLSVVNTTLRPGSGDTTLVVVKNNGEQDALIERIRFRPEADYETKDDIGLTSNVTTIMFGKFDNTSNRPGYHGVYDQQLSQKLRIPAGESLTIRVIIDDEKYEGYAFSGKLILEYNGNEPLTVESARVAFHGKS